MARARHRKFDLLDNIVEAVNESGFNVLYVGDIKEHPFVLKIYNESESYLLRIYIWNLTPGGGGVGVRPVGEYRVQFTSVTHFEKQQGEKTLILGWWEQVGVFAGFDYNKRNAQIGKSPSAQIKEESLRNALINGFSAYDRGNGEIAIAFRPDFFGDYVRDLEELHQLGESQREIEIVDQVAAGNLEINSVAVQELPEERQVIIATVNRKLREKSFAKRVLTAYGNQCAFSGMQLKLVDAAHILPVSEPTSTDETSNGIALSALYHRAFDRGFVTLNDQYQIIVHNQKLEQLREIGYDGGIDAFTNLLRPIIIVPPAINDRPNANFIREANRLRGW